jgi:hypothetical protein
VHKQMAKNEGSTRGRRRKRGPKLDKVKTHSSVKVNDLRALTGVFWRVLTGVFWRLEHASVPMSLQA